MSFVYKPDEDLKVHHEGAIRLLCQGYRSHENGLPEWAKNSADAYINQDADANRRVIVLIFSDRQREREASISCLDFVGMTRRDIEQFFRHWADPDAAARGGERAEIQGGHGNGGKCYMTQMFEDHAYLHTVSGNRGSKYGIAGGTIRFGYIPDREHGRDFPVPDRHHELEKALASVGLRTRHLPQAAIQSLSKASGFTLVTGFKPRDYSGRIPTRELLERLISHHQMIRTLQLCQVFAVVNGDHFNEGRPLALPEVTPLPGAEDPRVIEIPEMLVDPISEREVSSTNRRQYPPGRLLLKTSDVSMRWKRKWRHTIVFRAKSGYIGMLDMTELIHSYYGDRIYGDCDLLSLEEYKQNDRLRLAESALTRAVNSWIRQQVEAYAKEFERIDRRRVDQEEKNALSRMNAALDHWKNQFLEEMIQGLWGPGEGTPRTRTREIYPAGKPARIEVSVSHSKAGVGVSLRPTIKFFDASGQRIRPVPYRWQSSDNNVAMVDEELLTINTFSFGGTEIHAETLDRKLKSNRATLEVVHIHDITVVPDRVTVRAGSRQKLEAFCRLATGEETSDAYLVWTESNSSVARVSSAGLVFGFQPGECQVYAGDDRCLSRTPSTITVLPASGRGHGDESGRGYPRILISEIDPDPETGEIPAFSPQEPPVHQRVQDVDRNIWWINMACPLARRYLDAARGYGYRSREWRVYHLERYIEAMVKIVLTLEAQKAEQTSFENWMRRWDEMAPQMQEHAVSSLEAFLDEGVLPGEERAHG